MTPEGERREREVAPVTVNLTREDIRWLDERRRRTAESRSTILRAIVREAREREQARRAS